MKRLKKSESGITLVALIVTIIILLILIGIAIAALTTQTGLFEKAKQAKKITENKYEKENITLAEYENKINESINGSRDEKKNNYGEINLLGTFNSLSGSIKYDLTDYKNLLLVYKTMQGKQTYTINKNLLQSEQEMYTFTAFSYNSNYRTTRYMINNCEMKYLDSYGNNCDFYNMEVYGEK